MSGVGDRERIAHALDFARRAVRLSTNRSRDDLDRDEHYNLAMLHLVQLIGEATAQISKELRERNPQSALGEHRRHAESPRSWLRYHRCGDLLAGVVQ
jgi:uncharacterized protein with HEPN domain